MLNVIGEDSFRRLLGINPGGDLVFVIDSTGSMREEIYAVKQEVIKIVEQTKDTYDAPSRYIIVLFNDPGTTFLLI